MIWSLIAQVITLVIDLLTLRYSANNAKDLELLVLRQQIRILERRVGKPVRPSRIEKLVLALTAVHLKERAQEGRNRLNSSILIFKPATVSRSDEISLFDRNSFACHSIGFTLPLTFVPPNEDIDALKRYTIFRCQVNCAVASKVTLGYFAVALFRRWDKIGEWLPWQFNPVRSRNLI
jgi:hypothetical protein